MYDWERQRIKELKNSVEKNNIELNMRINKLEKLKNNPKVQAYLELVNDEDVQDYIKNLKNCKELQTKISDNKNTITKIHQEICSHNELLFISDETSDYTTDENIKYYRCMCLNCGIVSKFQFINGKRDHSYLINIGKLNEEDLPKFQQTYKDLKSKKIYRDDITHELALKNKSKVKTKKFINIEF